MKTKMKLIITALVFCTSSSAWADDNKSTEEEFAETTYSIIIKQESNEGKLLNKSKTQTIVENNHNKKTSSADATITINVGTQKQPIYWEIDLGIEGYTKKVLNCVVDISSYQFLRRGISDGSAYASPLTICKTYCKIDKSGETVLYENLDMKLTLIFKKMQNKSQ